jgi:tetratricopeptide (TPR) repeat protein
MRGEQGVEGASVDLMCIMELKMTSNSQDAVAEMLESEGDWAGLAGHLRERIDAEDPAYYDLTNRLAHVLETELGRPSEAAETLEWLLNKVPGDTDVRHALERLHSEADNWAGLIGAYRAGVSAEAAVDDKTALLRKIYRVQTDAVVDIPAGRSTCIETLSIDPSSDWAWSHLEASHASDESWWELIKELTQAAMGAGERTGPITLHIATVMDEHLGQIDKAIALYEAAIEGGANELTALEGLEALYAETENWAQLSHTYERMLPLALDADERGTLRGNWAMVLSDGLNDIQGAIALYDAILEEDPEDKEAFQVMLALQKRAS